MITEKTAAEIIAGNQRLEIISRCIEDAASLAGARLEIVFRVKGQPDKKGIETLHVPSSLVAELLQAMRECEEALLDDLNTLAVQEAQE